MIDERRNALLEEAGKRLVNASHKLRRQWVAREYGSTDWNLREHAALLYRIGMALQELDTDTGAPP